MLIQIVLGIPLEMVHKWWRLIIIYFAGGIGGSMLYSIIESSRLAGASGSVYAIMSAHVANVIMVKQFNDIQNECSASIAELTI